MLRCKHYHTHSDQAFTYTQLARQGVWALFCQQHKVSGVQRFEVVRIREVAAHTWPNGSHTPAHEVYPGTAKWGIDGWTFHTRATAERMLQRVSARKEEERT